MLLSGALVASGIVEIIKQVPWIKSITPETKGRVLALAAVLSSVSGVLIGVGTGQIDAVSWQDLAQSVWNAIVTFGLAQGGYQTVTRALKMFGA